MTTVSKFNNKGFTAEVRRFLNKKNKPCYVVFSNDKEVYSNIFLKKSTALEACRSFLRQKANQKLTVA